MPESKMIDVRLGVPALPVKEHQNGTEALLLAVQDPPSCFLRWVQPIKHLFKVLAPFPRQLSLLALASAIAIPACVAQDQGTTDTSSGSGWKTLAPDSRSDHGWKTVDSQPPANPEPRLVTPAKEGYWAQKDWVRQQIHPINDLLSELDEVNAKNAQDIKDFDTRTQPGIRKALSAADTANQTAMAANSQARNADSTARMAANHADLLKSTMSGLDQFHQIIDLEVKFRGQTTALSDDSKTRLDQLALSLKSRRGYILEMAAYAPGAGSIGIRGSERLAEAVEQYLVTQHQIPSYRMHFVALGNQEAPASGSSNQSPEPVKTGSVRLSLMENSLAAWASASAQSTSAVTGSAQP
jgi:outer membrane protein OmpA-like peptidoglycan-associated protein